MLNEVADEPQFAPDGLIYADLQPAAHAIRECPSVELAAQMLAAIIGNHLDQAERKVLAESASRQDEPQWSALHAQCRAAGITLSKHKDEQGNWAFICRWTLMKELPTLRAVADWLEATGQGRAKT